MQTTRKTLTKEELVSALHKQEVYLSFHAYQFSKNMRYRGHTVCLTLFPTHSIVVDGQVVPDFEAATELLLVSKIQAV